MSKEDTNVALLKDAYAQYTGSKGGQVDHWFALMADDIDFGSLGASEPHPQLAFTRAYSGRETLRGYFSEMLKDWAMLDFTVREFVAQGEAVVMRAHMRWRNKTTSKVFESQKIDFWRFKDGKAVEFYEYFDTAGARAAATA